MTDDSDENSKPPSTEVYPSLLGTLPDEAWDGILDTPVFPSDEAMLPATGPERRKHLSFSQLDTYRTCSWKYYLRYLTDTPSEPSLPLKVGTSGHLALEQSARKKIKTGDYMPLEEVLDVFSDSYDNETQELTPDHLDEDEDIGKSKDNTVQVITVQQHQVRKAPILPMAVEWEFNIDLSLPEYDYPLRVVNGKVDLVTTNLEVMDYKFPSRRAPKTTAEANMSPQLTLYDRAVYQTTGKYPLRLGFVSMLPPGADPVKTPAKPTPAIRDPELLTPTARNARWERLAYQFMQTDKGIDAGIFIPADDPRTCSWCDYRRHCQASLAKDDYLAASIRRQTGAPPNG